MDEEAGFYDSLDICLGSLSGGVQNVDVFPECVIEWHYWRNGIPSTYATIGEMPVDTGIGFRYLVNKYGKEGLTEAQSFHEQMAERYARMTDSVTGMTLF